MSVRNNVSDEVLLVFPPGAHNIAHPEIGLPQVMAHLRAEGVRARQCDLNAEFVYDHLTRPEVLAGIHERLRGLQGATDASSPEHWFLALDRLAAEYGRSATLGGAPIRTFLTERRAVRGRPFPHWQARAGAVAEGTDPFTARCRSDGLFWAAFVEALHYLLFSPRTTRVEDVLDFAEELPPFLFEFLASRLDEWATGERPSMVGLALWCTAQVPIGMGFAKLLRLRWPGVPIVAGAAWCSGADSLLPTFPELFDVFDAVVIGQGEDAMAELARRALEGGDFRGIDNVAVRVDGRVRVPPRIRSRRLVDTHLPEFDGLDLSLYPQGDILPVRLQESCVWRRCTVCYHFMDRIHGGPVSKDPERVVARAIGHIRQLAGTWGVKRVFLLDHAVPLATLRLFARRAIEEGVELQWLTMARFEPGYDAAVVEELAASGCIGLHFGLETTDPALLSRMKKGIELETVDRDLRAVAGGGIPASVFLMHLPGQTLHDVERDIAWAHARHEVLQGFKIARFEVGRGTYGFRNPAQLGVVLRPGLDRDIDVFDVKYDPVGPMVPILELMDVLQWGTSEHARLRGEHIDVRTRLCEDDAEREDERLAG